MKTSKKKRMNQPESPARQHTRGGKSHYRFEDSWYEEEFTNAIISDTRISIDILTEEDGEKDTVIVTAVSTDNGHTYSGSYKYQRDRTNVGQVEFIRYRGRSGDIFKGQWVAADGSRDLWFIEVDPPE